MRGLQSGTKLNLQYVNSILYLHTAHFLYNTDSREAKYPEELKIGKIYSLLNSSYNPSKDTKFLIHGWMLTPRIFTDIVNGNTHLLFWGSYVLVISLSGKYQKTNHSVSSRLPVCAGLQCHRDGLVDVFESVQL